MSREGNSLGERPLSAEWMDGRTWLLPLPLPFSGDVAAQEDGGERDCKEGREMRFFRSGDCLISPKAVGGWSMERLRSERVRVETLSRCGRC